MKFESNRTFKIWAHTVSHSSLLIRSYLKLSDEEGFNEENSYNIDLEFLSVEYMDVKSTLNSLSISVVRREDLDLVLQERFNAFRGKIFEISSDNNKYYIIAYSLLIGTNKWVQYDRIFNYNLNLKHDKIIWSVND